MIKTINQRDVDGPLDNCEFISSLSDERLEWLIVDPILGGDLLHHAATCATCGERVAELAQRDFDSLSPEEKRICQGPAGIDHNQTLINLLRNKDEEVGASRGVLPLAASSTSDDISDDDWQDVATATISGVQVTFWEDKDGYVFITGNIPLSATGLKLANLAFRLQRSEHQSNSYKVEGLGVVEAVRWHQAQPDTDIVDGALVLSD